MTSNHSVEEFDDRDELERALQRLLPGPVVRGSVGFGGDVYLPCSWLSAAHSMIVREQEDVPHEHQLGPRATDEQYLVSIGNRLDLDVDELLAAEPEEELRILYSEVKELDSTR